MRRSVRHTANGHHGVRSAEVLDVQTCGRPGPSRAREAAREQGRSGLSAVTAKMCAAHPMALDPGVGGASANIPHTTDVTWRVPKPFPIKIR